MFKIYLSNFKKKSKLIVLIYYLINVLKTKRITGAYAKNHQRKPKFDLLILILKFCLTFWSLHNYIWVTNELLFIIIMYTIFNRYYTKYMLCCLKMMLYIINLINNKYYYTYCTIFVYALPVNIFHIHHWLGVQYEILQNNWSTWIEIVWEPLYIV